MELNTEELMLIREVAAGTFDKEIAELTALKAEVSKRLEALGGMERANALINESRDVRVKAETLLAQAQRELDEARRVSQDLLAEANAEREKAGALLIGADAEAKRTSAERARWEGEFNRLNAEIVGKQQAVAKQEQIQFERVRVLAEKEQQFKDNVLKVKQLLGL